jgi:cell wall-associated NlpC family hydrolase
MSALDDITLAPRAAPYASPLQLIGVPYLIGGRSPALGFDCFTLLAYVRWHWYGRATPIALDLTARPMSATRACAWGIARSVSAWRACAPSEGCAVALGRAPRSRLHHCGVMVGGGVLHAFERTGVVLTPLDRLPGVFARVECYECA